VIYRRKRLDLLACAFLVAPQDVQLLPVQHASSVHASSFSTRVHGHQQCLQHWQSTQEASQQLMLQALMIVTWF
jgi:hypothetical protein